MKKVRRCESYRAASVEQLENRMLLSAPGFGFAFGIGAGGDDGGNAIAVDSSGNIYVTGAFQGTADFDPGPGVANLASAGGFDVFVAKYTSGGALVWARSMGGVAYESGKRIAVGADGSVCITGVLDSANADFDPGAGTYTLSSAGSHDIFVSKLDSSGNFVWARRMGGAGDDYGYGITVGTDGSV